MPQAVAYCRLSDANERSGSIANQKRKVIEYCERYGLELLQTFVDDGKSGWTFDRPGFKELEDFCKKNKAIQYLIIPHFDRFSRADPIDAMVKERYFRDKLNVKVLQVSEPPETDVLNPTYQIIRFMQAFVANEERNRIIDRTISGMRHSLMNGRYCSKAPFGYLNSHDENNKPIIVIDKDKVDIVKTIFRDYIAGVPVEEIRSKVKKQGFNQQGRSSIQRIVTNPLYAGLIRVPAYKHQPEAIVKGIHEPIVSESDYWSCIDIGKPHKFHQTEDVPLKGVLHCECGKLFTAAPSKGKLGKYYWYYFCNTHRKGNYSAIKIHTSFVQLLQALSFTKEEADLLKVKFIEGMEKFKQEKGKALMTIGLKINKVESQITQIETKYLLNNVSEETYKKVIQEKRIELSHLSNERVKYEADNTVLNQRMEKILSVITDIAFMWERMPLDLKQKFIKVVFGQNLQYTGGTYRTQYLHPAFLPKALILKEKGLLTLSTTLLNSEVLLPSAPSFTAAEPSILDLTDLYSIFGELVA